uniref:Pyrrolo-quinoline quinone n=1 Tax=Schlesneria paludicola TaxID=360056 RepID=A0A7C2K266_9PLAN
MARGTFINALLVAAVIGTSDTVWSGDWPQWMGPGRDGVWDEAGVIDSIPADGLTVKWRVPVHAGYSGPAVAAGKVYLTEFERQAGEAVNDPGRRAELKGIERVRCFHAETGEELWQHAYERSYSISYPSGPRATPTVSGGKVYALGAEGNLWCLDAHTGDVAWSKDLQQAYKTTAPIWGFCAAPLVDGQKLICVVGGEGSVAVAFDKETGRELWRALSASEPGYAPPTVITAAGVRQLLIWDADKINSLNPETGQVYWSQPLKPNYGMSIMSPRQSGEYLFASGMGKVGALFRLKQDQPGAEVVWRGQAKTALYAANTTPLIEDGVIYGVDCDTGFLMGVDLETGRRLWETPQPTTGDRRGGHGTAFLVKHGDRHFLFSETGDLILAKLRPSGYEELGRFHVIEPTNECFGRNVVWTHPAFSSQSLFARNDKELVCVSLKTP